jgi:hypothetical protein
VSPDGTASPPGLPVASLASRMLVAMVVSAALVAGSFAWQAHYGFNIDDEGFLWYGAQRVMAGEIPLVDFVSYDPGRYYWSAALMAGLRDNGILALRAAVAVFQLLGLFVGLLLLTRKPRPDAVLFMLAAVTLFVWMFPRHKTFDISLSIMLIGVLTLLVQQPSRRRFFFAGVGVGLVAVFGRNHGIYGVAGVLGVTIYLACRQRNVRGLVTSLACCGCGVVVGYLPILVMIVAVPGFATVFWESIRLILDRDATNLPLPVPWPWRVPVTQLPPATAAADVLMGIFFIAILAFGVLGVLWIVRQALRQRPVAPEFVACSVLALPYAHFAFSRADIGHLAQGIFPLLIAVFVLLKDLPRDARWGLGLATAAASLMVILPVHPGWDCRVTQHCAAVNVAGDVLKVEPQMADILTTLKSAVDQYAPNGRSFVVTPLWPGAYAFLGRKSPMREIYGVFPRGDEFQRREIERIKAAQPGLVLTLNIALDGRDNMRFSNTHPLIERFIRDNFEPISFGNWPPQIYQFYKSR